MKEFDDTILIKFCEDRGLDFDSFSKQFTSSYLPLAKKIHKGSQELDKPTFVVGISAAQGSGKSTLCELVKEILEHSFNHHVVAVSLDDFYFSKKQRLNLAESVHPLFKTRGVPGTHDIGLALSFLKLVVNSTHESKISVPRFNKASDDKIPESLWSSIEGKVDILLLEGWCLGATPCLKNTLSEPINQLEERVDEQGIWRQFWNNKLSNEYQILFNQIDRLIYFQAPSWETVVEWRKQQEEKLRSKLALEGLSLQHSMNDSQLDEFMMHFERLTRHCMTSLSQVAHETYLLDQDRNIELN